jgi:hypothetical protein
VANPMRMQVPIYNSSLSCAAPSPLELVRMLLVFGCFLSLFWGRWSSGSMRTWMTELATREGALNGSR